VEYTFAAALAAALVVALEFLWLKTGLFRKVTFYVSWAIILFFMVLVNGWLTKLTAPIVLYNEDKTTGVRFPWDIPVEDYLFGFALLTLTMLLWERAGRGDAGDGSSRQRGIPLIRRR
jgi:lycopene cyclase domain-containing protein